MVFFCFAILVALLLLILRVIVVVFVVEGGRWWWGVGSSSNSKLFSGSSFRLATNKLRLAFCAANCGAAAAVCAALSAQRRRLLLTPTQTHAEFRGQRRWRCSELQTHTHTRTHTRKVELRNKLSSAKLPFELCQKNSTESTEKK